LIKMFHVKQSLTLICSLAAVVFFVAARGQETKPPVASTDQSTAARRVPVLVELFTSEGCSSCPPADALLAQFEAQQPISGAEVVALEEHVDYWNQQGWLDPFSSAQWTERQQKYAASRRDEQIYTPQMVINGHAQFVGSHESQARHEIEQAALQPGMEISLEATPAEKKDAARFKVAVAALSSNDAGDQAEVWLAVTESGLHSAVKAGENSGRDVHHADVIRILHKLGAADAHKSPSFSAEHTVKLDHSWNRQNLRTIAFVQEKRSLRVLGARSIRIEP
jgi:hypothetical protein